jgi:TorA maturation chaperone TorD
VNAGDDTALAPAARLLGRLLVRELDAATVAELAQPEIAAALAELGIALPTPDQLDALAHEYFTLLLHPTEGRPPVQSLWLQDRYDGDAAASVRTIARAAARELAPGARSAPPDHLGCVLLLWAELVDERPELAAHLARDHFAWSERALHALAETPTFYGAVARGAIAFVRAVREPRD